jgi:prevent-host-death family protein
VEDQTNKQPEIISATTLKQQSGSILRRVAKDRQHFVVERDGFPVAVIIPIVDYEIFNQTLGEKNEPQ